MKIRILGPLEVERDGHRVALGPKQQTLLAILLVNRGSAVSADRIVDDLYAGRPPRNALKTLQVHVSRLRKALGDGKLETTAAGYRLASGADSLDVDQFEELVDKGRLKLAEGDIESAATLLAEALALWRGPALAEFVYADFAQAEIARLEERRLEVLEDRIDADLALARHSPLIAELEALVRGHPLRERLRGQLMLALYRSGRQAEALNAYQDARRALTDELGIEPSRSLRDLQQAMLEQRAGLELDTPEPAADAFDARREPSILPDAMTRALERGARPERKIVTVLHVQVGVSSAEGDDVDPEVLQRVLSAAFGDITAAVEAHEGTIDATTGDSIRGIFGLPFVHEDDPARAVRAADEIQMRVRHEAERLARESTRRLEARIGVSTGEVITGGASGSPLGATGAPLTTAAQLAQEAELDHMAIDDTTRRAIATRGDAGRFASPMVGRARERRRLHDAFEQAVSDSSCQLFTILGAAGVGKSRLVQEFLGDLDGRGLIARGRCLPYGEGITFWPVVEAIKDIGGLDEASTSDDAQSSLAALIGDTENAPLVAQRVSEAIGLIEASVGIEEGFEAVRTFFEALASRSPLVVVFDDVHWGESTFLDLVEHLADWSRGAPILLLCVARPELLDARGTWGGGKVNATSVLLEPLSDRECIELVANLVGEAQLAEEVEARIATAAEGNPLFVEEMLSMLIDDAILVREDGRWIAAGDITAVPVPPTIHALLATRLDQLSSDERAVFEAAAVEGKLFHEASVAHLAPHVKVPAALATLVRKELIRPDRPVFAGERAFRFRHLLIRDAAYDAIPKEGRAALHERHVEWLEQKTGERAVEFDEIVGYHLEQAVRYRTELGQADERSRALGRHAAELLGDAGRRAFARSDAPAGLKLISRAVALLSPEDPLRIDLIPNVRVVQGMEDLSWADKALTEAVEAAATTGNRSMAAHALVQRALLRLFTAPVVDSAELVNAAEQAIRVFDDLGDELGLARAWRLIAQARYLAGRAELCVDASERALAHARRVNDAFERREIAEWLAIAFVLGPQHATEVGRRCELLLDEFHGEREVELQFLGTLAYIAGIQGRIERFNELIALTERTVDILNEWMWLVPVHFAWFALARAEPAAAERALREGYEKLKRIGETSHFSSYAGILAQAVYDDGRYDEAEQLAREALAAARPNDVHTNITARGTVAKVLARRGDLERSEELAREAIALAQTTDFLHSHADALTDLAEVLALVGRTDESAAALEGAVALHEQKGNLLAVETIRRRAGVSA